MKEAIVSDRFSPMAPMSTKWLNSRAFCCRHVLLLLAVVVALCLALYSLLAKAWAKP